MFTFKRDSAEQQRIAAQRDYEKIMQKKKGVFGNLRIAHSDVSGKLGDGNDK